MIQNLKFKCPDCGGTYLCAHILVSRTIGRMQKVTGPERDICHADMNVHMDGGDTHILYDEEFDTENVTDGYFCRRCRKEFPTLGDALECCTESLPDGIEINNMHIADSLWLEYLEPCEKADLVSSNIFDMMGREQIIDIIRSMRVACCEAEAAKWLGIREADVEDTACCIVLGSTGRVAIVK